MICPIELDPRLGAAKVLIELAESIRKIGCAECELVGPAELGTTRLLDSKSWQRFSAAHRAFVRRSAPSFDVVDFDHESLPYPRTEFDPGCLMVARSVLLVHHLEAARFPVTRSLRSTVGQLLHGRARARFTATRIEQADLTISAADLVNVSNDRDAAVLHRRGIPAAKTIVLPYGLTRARRQAFELECAAAPSGHGRIAFIGTFDPRKGASDLPLLACHVLNSIPHARFRLMGTAGLTRCGEDVLRAFPRSVRGAIEVVPRFEPQTLPRLLRDCDVGVFPSYLEGFGFGVLEMLAAAIPVVAYDVPGPHMMLGKEWLVPPGDVQAMASKVTALLRDSSALARARVAARRASEPFDWGLIAQQTIAAYKDRAAHLGIRRSLS